MPRLNYNYISADILKNPDTFTDTMRITIAGPVNVSVMMLECDKLTESGPCVSASTLIKGLKGVIKHISEQERVK